MVRQVFNFVIETDDVTLIRSCAMDFSFVYHYLSVAVAHVAQSQIDVSEEIGIFAALSHHKANPITQPPIFFYLSNEI